MILMVINCCLIIINELGLLMLSLCRIIFRLQQVRRYLIIEVMGWHLMKRSYSHIICVVLVVGDAFS